MSDAHSITAIIPVFRRGHLMARSIFSVLGQQSPPEELIVVDDGSGAEDESVAKIKKIFTEYKGPVKCQLHVLPENKGVSHARNFGAKKAAGEWLAFLDSDDEWLPEKLRLQKEFLSRHPHYPLVHTNEIWMRDGKVVAQKSIHQKGGGDQFLPSIERCVIGPSTALMNKSVFMQLGMFDESMPVCEDYDLWLRLTARHEIGFLPTPLIHKYGGHKDQLSTQFTSMDYWRITSLARLLKSALDLPLEKKRAALKFIGLKARVLIQGYEKHENLTNHGEVLGLKIWSDSLLEIN